MASFLSPRKSAMGSENRMVPRFPNSCKISAGPTETSFDRLAPAETPILAINGASTTSTRLPPSLDSGTLKSLNASGPNIPPIIVANTMGNMVSVPIPIFSLTVPIKSQITAMTSAAA